MLELVSLLIMGVFILLIYVMLIFLMVFLLFPIAFHSSMKKYPVIGMLIWIIALFVATFITSEHFRKYFEKLKKYKKKK